MNFNEISISELKLNPITFFADEWPLLTAGNALNGFNTMTVAWGHIGAIWSSDKGIGIPTMIVYIRPQRYTKEFVDSNEIFSLSVLPAEYKETLTYLGTVSGRDEDKVTKARLTPVFDDETTYFAEAKQVFICRKIYNSPLLEDSFINKSIVDKNYPNKDFHTMYFGEIIRIMEKQ